MNHGQFLIIFVLYVTLCTGQDHRYSSSNKKLDGPKSACSLRDHLVAKEKSKTAVELSQRNMFESDNEDESDEQDDEMDDDEDESEEDENDYTSESLIRTHLATIPVVEHFLYTMHCVLCPSCSPCRSGIVSSFTPPPQKVSKSKVNSKKTSLDPEKLRKRPSSQRQSIPQNIQPPLLNSEPLPSIFEPTPPSESELPPPRESEPIPESEQNPENESWPPVYEPAPTESEPSPLLESEPSPLLESEPPSLVYEPPSPPASEPPPPESEPSPPVYEPLPTENESPLLKHELSAPKMEPQTIEYEPPPPVNHNPQNEYAEYVPTSSGNQLPSPNYEPPPQVNNSPINAFVKKTSAVKERSRKKPRVKIPPVKKSVLPKLLPTSDYERSPKVDNYRKKVSPSNIPEKSKTSEPPSKRVPKTNLPTFKYVRKPKQPKPSDIGKIPANNLQNNIPSPKVEAKEKKSKNNVIPAKMPLSKDHSIIIQLVLRKPPH